MLDVIPGDRGGFGLDFRPAMHSISIDNTAANTACFRFDLTTIIQVMVTVNIGECGDFTQVAHVTNRSTAPAALPYSVGLCLSLNRASYGQLTEGGPIPLPQSLNQLEKGEQNSLTILNPCLGAQLLVALTLGDAFVDLSSVDNQERFDRPLETQFDSICNVPPRSTLVLRTIFRLHPDSGKFDRLAWARSAPQSTIGCQSISAWKDDHTITTYIIKRNLHYILSNCLVPITDEIVAIITDHVALPLGWNRDN